MVRQEPLNFERVSTDHHPFANVFGHRFARNGAERRTKHFADAIDAVVICQFNEEKAGATATGSAGS